MGDAPDSIVLKSRYAGGLGLDYFECDKLILEQMSGDPNCTMITFHDKKVYAYGTREKHEKALGMTVNDIIFDGQKA